MNATVIVSLQAKPDHVEALLAFLSSIQDDILKAGGQSVSLLQDQDDPTRCFEVEVWPSADDHKRFVEKATSTGMFEPLDSLLAVSLNVYYLDTVKYSEG